MSALSPRSEVQAWFERFAVFKKKVQVFFTVLSFYIGYETLWRSCYSEWAAGWAPDELFHFRQGQQILLFFKTCLTVR